MALLAPQPTVATGLVPSYSAVNASDTFVPAKNRYLHVKNTNAATRTVTVTTYSTGVGGVAVTDWVGTVGANTGELIMGPFPGTAFTDPATGLATVTYSATTNVTAALVELATPAGA